MQNVPPQKVKKVGKSVPKKYPPSQSRDAQDECKSQMGDLTFSLLRLYSKFKSYFEDKENKKYYNDPNHALSAKSFGPNFA